MAMSNWDTLAFDSEGKSCNGMLKIPSGAWCEIYKNTLHLGHPKMWVEGEAFSEDVVASVYEGSLHIAGFDIHASRHDLQGSIFAYVSHYDFKGDKKYQRFSGIGCYGFMDEIEWIKKNHPQALQDIDPKYFDSEKYMECSISSSDGWWGFDFIGEGEGTITFKMDIPKPDLNDLWLGVTEETLKAFMEWLKTVAPKEYFDKVSESEKLRFNQGDAYISSHLGQEIPSTEIGEKSSPMIGGLIDKMELDRMTGESGIEPDQNYKDHKKIL